VDCDTLERGDDDGLNDRCGEIDMDVLDVTLLELVTEVLSATDAESDALAFAVVVVDDTSEGDTVTKIEKETAADDDTLADAEVLDVDDELVAAEGVADGVICNDEESTEDALTLSDIKEDELTFEDGDADTEILEDEDVEGEPDNVAMTDASDEIETEEEILEVSSGLFEEEAEEDGVELTVLQAVALIVGG
jgi:hypothetical protein